MTQPYQETPDGDLPPTKPLIDRHEDVTKEPGTMAATFLMVAIVLVGGFVLFNTYGPSRVTQTDAAPTATPRRIVN